MPLWLLFLLVGLAVFASGAIGGWLLRGEEHAANQQADLATAMQTAAARGELHLDPDDDWFADRDAA